MKTVNVHEANTKLSSILQQIEEHGERFFICRNGKPVADLVPHERKNRHESDSFLSKVKVNCGSTAPMTEEDWELD